MQASIVLAIIGHQIALILPAYLKNQRAASANSNKIFACGICSKPTLLGQQRRRNNGSLHGLRDAKLLTKRSATSYHDVRCQVCVCLLGLSWRRLHTSTWLDVACFGNNIGNIRKRWWWWTKEVPTLRADLSDVPWCPTKARCMSHMTFGARDVMNSNYIPFFAPYCVVSETHHCRSIQERYFQSLVVSDCVFFFLTQSTWQN